VKIAAFPLGLLDLLRAQNFGQNPGNLADTIAPTVDVSGMLFANRMEVLTTTGDVVANGENGTKAFVAAVPAGQLWIVHRLSHIFSAAAGESGISYTILRMNGNVLALSSGITTPASRVAYDISYDYPLILPPGASVGIWGAAIVGVPTGGINLMYTRLKV